MHILNNTMSCIVSGFASQPSLIKHSCVDPSLHSNYQHQIIFFKLNLKICCSFPYEQLVWHHQHANVSLICGAVNLFYWEKTFCNLDFNKHATFLWNHNEHLWKLDSTWDYYLWWKGSSRKKKQIEIFVREKSKTSLVT